MPRLSLIVAMTPDGVIGRDQDLPWRLSSDLRRFKQITMGHTMVMGRKTFDSIGRALPGRTSVVVTRQLDYTTPLGVLVAHTLDEALDQAGDAEEIFVIGGGEMYRLALPRADRLYITWVHADISGDTTFPDWDRADWHLVEQLPRAAANDRNQYDATFEVYQRRG